MPYDDVRLIDGQAVMEAEPAASLTSVSILKRRRGGKHTTRGGANGAVPAAPARPAAPRPIQASQPGSHGSGMAAASPTEALDAFSIPVPSGPPPIARRGVHDAVDHGPLGARDYQSSQSAVDAAPILRRVTGGDDGLSLPHSRPAQNSGAETLGPTTTSRIQAPSVLVARWAEARANLRRLPGLLFIDQHDIAVLWPNSLLMAVSPGRGGMTVTPVQRFLPQPGSNGVPIEFDTTLVQWVCAAAQEAARLGKAVRDDEAVHTSRGWERFGCLALPLSSNGKDLDRVLCHIHPL